MTRLAKASLNRYREALDSAVGLSKRDLRAVFRELMSAGAPPEVVRDTLIEATYGITAKHGDVVAAATAEWYGDIRPPYLKQYTPKLGATAPFEQVEGSVRYAAGHLWGEDPGQTLKLLEGAVQRYVAGAGRDTVTVNAARDPSSPRFARVPAGSKTCAFCTMLASRGFVYATAESAKGREKDFHDDCRCVIVPSWGAHPAVEGYDPEALYNVYEASIVRDGGQVNYRATLANMRRKFPNRFTDGVRLNFDASGGDAEID